jgi:8-oxo-dGTP diphosphatase
MKTKKGAMAIIYREEGEKRLFLLLHRVKGWTGWEFVKGGIEFLESVEAAARREAKEEAGLDLKKGLLLDGEIYWEKENKKYFYRIVLFKTSEQSVRVSGIEHDSFCWVEEEKVNAMLSHEGSRKAFKQAMYYLENKN